VDGSDPSCFGGDAFYDFPVWAPDSRSLVFASDLGGTTTTGLFAASIDTIDAGGDLTEVIPAGPDNAAGPVYAPGGDRIAFLRTAEGNTVDADVWVADAGGANARQVFASVIQKQELAWSPDGSWIAAPGSVSRDGGLWLIDPDGAASGVLTGTMGLDCHNPVWSLTGDGWPLFFTVGSLEQRDLWVAPSLEAGAHRFAGADWGPLWSADGTRAVLGFAGGSGSSSQTAVHAYSIELDFQSPLTVTLGTP
jgi:Tol biopolymer transport system component